MLMIQESFDVFVILYLVSIVSMLTLTELFDVFVALYRVSIVRNQTPSLPSIKECSPRVPRTQANAPLY